GSGSCRSHDVVGLADRHGRCYHPAPMRCRAGRMACAAAAALSCAIGCALTPGPSGATPYDNIPVGDPIEDELRVLDLFPSAGLHGRIRLPHLATRPLQSIELQGLGAPPDSLDVPRAIAVARIERALGRDRSPLF